MAGQVTFSQIRDSPSNDFETIYNQNLDNNVDDCGISPYDIVNANCKYYNLKHYLIS